jgi:YVTN family beta-propeller protein
MKFFVTNWAISVLVFFAVISCKKDAEIIDYEASGYPKEIAKIILPNCATTGCHNNLSRNAAAGLSLANWTAMFEGTRNKNAAVIPYSTNQSFLLFFINTFPEIGPTLKPTMPVNATPLSKEQVQIIKSWIAEGAPNNKGNIMFSGNIQREKMYVANQGCDLVSVFDLKSGLIMRYVEVGKTAQIESPHMIRVSADGKFWYVVFSAGNYFQKFSTSDDRLVESVSLGSGSWNTFTISPDSKTAFAVNWSQSGSVVAINLDSMKIIVEYKGAGLFQWPHGSYISKNNKWLYVTAQTGNFIYKIDITDLNNPDIQEIPLEAGIPSPVSKFDVHEIAFSEDEKYYYASCQKTNEIRVMDAQTDMLVNTIPTAEYPQEIVLSETDNLMFVTCPEDTLTFPGSRGAVTVINTKTNTVVKIINTGFQPHGIAVDQNNSTVYVAHRNFAPGGPAPHHAGACAGKNGYITAFNIQSLSLIGGYKPEVSIDPYSIAIRK